jgi:hypothetical protein
MYFVLMEKVYCF